MRIDSTGPMKHASIEGHRYGLIAEHAASTNDQGSIIDNGGIVYSILVGLQHKSHTPLVLNTIFTIIGPQKDFIAITHLNSSEEQPHVSTPNTA